MLRQATVGPLAMLTTVASLALALVSIAPASAAAAQRIDMKVLVLGTSATEPTSSPGSRRCSARVCRSKRSSPPPGTRRSPPRRSRTRWPMARRRPNTRRSSCRSASLPECTHDLCSTLSPTEWTALEEYEQTFNVRQITGDIFPSATYGLNAPTTIRRVRKGTQGTLTPKATKIFPYLKGPVPMDTGTFGYEATPLSHPGDRRELQPARSPARAARRSPASTRTRTASRKWSRPSTRTPTSCRPSCCATAR